jgi:hypothetical protein
VYHTTLKANSQYPLVPLPCRANSHMQCCAPAKLRKCRVVRESPRGSRKKPKLADRPQAVQSSHAMPFCAMALRSRLQTGMVGARQGHGVVCVNQTRSRCVIPMGETRNNVGELVLNVLFMWSFPNNFWPHVVSHTRASTFIFIDLILVAVWYSDYRTADYVLSPDFCFMFPLSWTQRFP